jgi:hypothetical protein
MGATGSYGSPTAFRRALTDKLRNAAETSRWTLPELQRQMAYDRLLERLYRVDDRWIVKGATALLARDIGVRATVDVDVYRPAAGNTAEADLREAAGAEVGDWFGFAIGPPRPVADAVGGVRLPATASIGPTAWASFHVDIVEAGPRMTGQPDHVPPLARVAMPGLEQHGYRAYPIVDHIADKVTAMYEVHGRTGFPSTRYKDLVDLVAIVSTTSGDAQAQLTALRSEAERRGLRLPQRFTVPDRRLWQPGYAAEARRSLLPTSRTLDQALAAVRPFLDPLLDGTAAGTWNPSQARWVS